MSSNNQTKTATDPVALGLLKTGLSKALELVLNKALRLDDSEGDVFAPLDEKVIQLSLTDLKLTFFIIYQVSDNADDTAVFSIQTHLMGAADSHIKLHFADFINLIKPNNANGSTNSSILVELDTLLGDPVLGNAFIHALQNIEIDWEEELSHMTGDLVAFKVGHAARTTKKMANEAGAKIANTLKEYAQFEINLVPTQSQVNRFSAQVTQTETAINALEERINTLLSTHAH